MKNAHASNREVNISTPRLKVVTLFYQWSRIMIMFLLSFITFSLAACDRVAPKAGNENNDTDWKNISQFQTVSPAGPDSIWVSTIKGNLLRVSKQSEQRKINDAGAVSVVAFIDSAHGWVVDRKSQIWTTTDGGNSWQITFVPKTTTAGFYLPQQLIFIDELHGWLVGIFQVWQTVDGGRSWQDRFSISSTTEERVGRLYRGAFIGSDRGWVASSGGVVIQTNDGGMTWKTSTPVSERADLHDVFFSDGQTGWIIGRPEGGVYSTSDGGKTWRSQFPSAEGTYLNSVDFVNRTEGWAVGWTVKNQDRVGLVLHSVDGGNNWAEVATGVRERFFDRVCFFDRYHGWVIARDVIYYTDDAGKNFRMVLKLPPVENSSN